MTSPAGESQAACELGLSLLGIAVRLRTNDPELARRLAVCYGASLASAAEGGSVLDAVLERVDEGWRVLVAGRDEALERDATAALRRFNHELMHGVMLGRPDLYFVHAAVVELGGRGLVLPGLSQAGKSTLALALLARGARYLSDELLAYEPRRKLAHAFPRAPKIRDVCAAYFPAFARYFVGSGEGRFLPFAAHPSPPAASTRVAAFVLPRWAGAGAPTELAPTSRGEALLALTRSSLNFGTHRARSVDCLTSLVESTRAWRLAWSEPLSAAARIEEALASAP
jgi:hypothetical protein